MLGYFNSLCYQWTQSLKGQSAILFETKENLSLKLLADCLMREPVSADKTTIPKSSEKQSHTVMNQTTT